MPENKEPNPSYLTSNSHASREKKESKKEIQKVVQGKAKVRKKPAGQRIHEAFIADDAKDVRSYLIWDVLIPAAKDTIADLVKKGIDALLYGDSKASSNVRRDRDRSYVSYSSYSTRRNDPPWNTDNRRPVSKPSRRARHDFSDICMEDRRDAENVLAELVDLVYDYGEASVADFYELVGISASYTDNGYGWTDLGDSKVLRTREGYIIDLPKPEPLD